MCNNIDKKIVIGIDKDILERYIKLHPDSLTAKHYREQERIRKHAEAHAEDVLVTIKALQKFCESDPNFRTQDYRTIDLIKSLRKKRITPMMSKDRIEFTPPNNPKDNEATIKAMMRAFSMDHNEAKSALYKGVRIRCRPSQFGRFIVYRVEGGVSFNPIKVMNVKLIPAQDFIDFIDLSKRENRDV